MNKLKQTILTVAALFLCSCVNETMTSLSTNRKSNYFPRQRIVCFGDSLTSCGGKNGRYSDALQKHLWHYEVINSGRGGDTIGGGLARLQKDVLSYRPKIAVIGFGANDYWRRRRTLNALRDDYDEMIARCTAAGVKVVLISCFGHDVPRPDTVAIDFDTTEIPLEHYAIGLAQIERELVEKYHCGYVPDMQVCITPKGRRDLWSDNNHPNARGNRIVALLILAEMRRVFPETR